jgi:hypothetical protein
MIKNGLNIHYFEKAVCGKYHDYNYHRVFKKKGAIFSHFAPTEQLEGRLNTLSPNHL